MGKETGSGVGGKQAVILDRLSKKGLEETVSS